MGEDFFQEEGEKEKYFYQNYFTNKQILMLLIVGFVFGFLIKTIATEKVTIGFEDYKKDSLTSDYQLMDEQKVKESQPSEKESPTALEDTQGDKSGEATNKENQSENKQ